MSTRKQPNSIARPIIRDGVALLLFGVVSVAAAQNPAPLSLTPAGEQFTQALAALPNPRALSITELQQLTTTMLSQETPDDLANAWAETLVWRFGGDNDESVPQQVAFTLYSQGMPLRRVTAGNQDAVLPALALDEILTARTENSRFMSALEWTYKLEPLAQRGGVPGAAAAVVLNLANRYIGTRDPSLPPLPPTNVFVNNNANLWLWEMLASELRGQKNPTLESRLARVDGPMERRTRRTTVRGWEQIGSLPSLGTQKQDVFSGAVPAAAFNVQPGSGVDAFFKQVQQYKAGFLPNDSTEQPASVREIQEIVGRPGNTNPSLAIEFCRVGNNYAAVIFDRTPPDLSRVAVVQAGSLDGVLAGLNRQHNYRALVVVLAIDCQFESGDYATLNKRFGLTRNRNPQCLLCPSLSMLTKSGSNKSMWTTEEVLRYAHYSGDFLLSEIPTARRVDAFSFLRNMELRTKNGTSVSLMCH